MALHTLQSGALRVIISDAGAEIMQIEDILTGRNYLWHGDSAYWGRRSPILFPIVGGLKNKTYKYAGREYPMSQHGFARDREFQMTEHNVDTIWFELKADEESLKVYPFRFRLEIGYRLEGRKITVMWRVANEDKKTMFSPLADIQHLCVRLTARADRPITICSLIIKNRFLTENSVSMVFWKQKDIHWTSEADVCRSQSICLMRMHW